MSADLDSHPLTHTEIGDRLFAAATELNAAMGLARAARIDVKVEVVEGGRMFNYERGVVKVDLSGWGEQDVVRVWGSIHTTESAWDSDANRHISSARRFEIA